MLVDFSTAGIARGKVRQAAREGGSIPPGVAQDRDGQPTTDAARALQGLLLPMGGERGLALGLLVELLAVLGGGRLSSDVPRAEDIWGGFGLGSDVHCH
jgi:LDH2 family malate/lactate/ureidoglycolate dehydrogenase